MSLKSIKSKITELEKKTGVVDDDLVVTSFYYVHPITHKEYKIWDKYSNDTESPFEDDRELEKSLSDLGEKI